MKEQIDLQRVPKHIAVIMDGNGRWAKQKGAARIFGHRNAITAVRDTVEGCAELGVGFLTMYAFSTENWNRPQDEVNALMELLVNTIIGELPTLNKNNVRLQAIGDLESLPAKCRKELSETIVKTSNNSGLTLILALSYSGRWEIMQAVKKMALDYKAGTFDVDNLSESDISNYLQTKDFPDPELMIRTSGELRISNFLLWQLAYAELYFTEILWPDFRKQNLIEAILDFQKRERRFGKTSEQLKVK